MKLVGTDDVRAWLGGTGTLSDHVRALGRAWTDRVYSERELGLPLHLRFVIERLSQGHPEGVPRGALDSIPFFSLCKGLFLPLSGLVPEKVAALFGMAAPEPPDARAREALLEAFLGRQVGLTLEQKLGCVLGDPFLGKPSTFRRDSLLRLLASVRLVPRRELLDRLPAVGDVAALFAEARPRLHEEPPLSAAEVLATLRFLPAEGRNFKFELLRSLLARMGKLEAYFLAKLMLRRAGFGFDYQGPLLARSLARAFETDEDRVEHAIALTSVFHVSKLLAEEGPEALRKIVLQPLSPVRPALASTAGDEIARFPVFVERKYDGIRLMLHKSTDARGSVLCGAYTRNRNDWLELVPGLDATIKLLPCRNAIVDGELHGTVIDLDRARPATVYEVHASLQGERARPVNLRFAAFDLVYLDGQDLTRLPLRERRRRLSLLVGGLSAMPLPVPVMLSEGQLATSREDVNRLFHHFRAQGYEGIIAKDLEQPYAIGARDPSWVKRKPELTLDLVLLGAVLAVTTKESAGRFGSYVIGARDEGGFVDVGDVAGVDRERDFQIQSEIQRAGLLTGRRIERPSSSGVRPGFELRPSIVVTVRFEGITEEGSSRTLKLRDPKLVAIRADKGASEADTVKSIEEAYVRQRMG